MLGLSFAVDEIPSSEVFLRRGVFFGLSSLRLETFVTYSLRVRSVAVWSWFGSIRVRAGWP